MAQRRYDPAWIRPDIKQRLNVIGKQLVALGYRDTPGKPGLFVRKCPGVTFYADMRGTEVVRIWEDPRPLMYHFPASAATAAATSSRMLLIEWMRLAGVPRRVAFEAPSIATRIEESGLVVLPDSRTADDGDEFSERAD